MIWVYWKILEMLGGCCLDQIIEKRQRNFYIIFTNKSIRLISNFMAVHNEDSRVKIPTILHIVTFGYDDLSLKAQKGNSNLFNDIFIKAKDLLVSNKLEVK